jgi:large subunit ribosomal protein L45
MLMNVDRKTIRWQLLKSLEPPRVVQIRVQDIMTKSNLFAQVTVRFHTQQILAVYDRFGRLIHGSPVVAKDVLEYVVFEKHIANVYGSWRLHAKIIPDWMEIKPAGILTHVLPPVKEEPEEAVEPESEKKEEESEEDSEGKVYDRFGRIIGKGK